MLLGREFQDFDPVTVKEQLIYFQARMMSDLEGNLQMVDVDSYPLSFEMEVVRGLEGAVEGILVNFSSASCR